MLSQKYQNSVKASPEMNAAKNVARVWMWRKGSQDPEAVEAMVKDLLAASPEERQTWLKEARLEAVWAKNLR